MQDFGDAISKNAEDTAEKTEQGYKEIKPDNKNPTDKYRSTDILKSDEKYTPKSDPKK